ncbi:MAG: ribbon-helix-helix protein, CopG family [Bacteroidetes bacterium]|nr:ribbon-helix-helix protein, CopG family [Bacteroidota bacterium]
MRKAVFTASITIYLTQDIYEKIKKITDERNISMAEYLRGAAEKYISEEEPAGRDPINPLMAANSEM